MGKCLFIGVAAVLLTSALAGQERRIDLRITPESSAFDHAADEYRDTWNREGQRIIAVMERATGLRFETGPIPVVVFEGTSSSGFRSEPMRLRASYPQDTKQATLVHELAHRLIGELIPDDFEDHPVIFLFVYDVWQELWGKAFADEQVAVESRRRGAFDYATGWRNALKLAAAERAAQFKQFLREHPSRP
jgi:hypothetical protein